MTTRIDKNVPIPGSGGSDKMFVIQKMDYGDSVSVSTQKEMSAWRAAITFYGYKAVSRKEKNGWRIWKMKHPSNESAN